MDRTSATEGGLRPRAHRGVRLFGRYFPTLAEYAHPSGAYLRIGARRHRKGKGPLSAGRAAAAAVPYWAPARLGWWIAVLFMIGSFCFALGAAAAALPGAAPGPLASAAVQNGVFFIGSLFFTAAASCQLAESLRALRHTALRLGTPGTTIALPLRFARLGYRSSLVQWFGTLLFNLNTFDALNGGEGWVYEEIVVWTPDFVGSVCFLVASHLAYLEIKEDTTATRLSRRIVAVNYLGAVAFMGSALCAAVPAAAAPPLLVLCASLLTLSGAVCFFAAAYLLLPELAEA